uniref:CX domain-containing protein n=1 Tax=Angiostrongylus cantonensis TaxID=6313 RepID=A0A0K0CZT9_ANGCA
MNKETSDLSQGQEAFPVEVYSDTENCDPPVEFIYISNNDYSTYRRRCSDQDSEGIAMGDGRVLINTDATFHNTLIVGCGEKCACMAQCKNTLRSKCLPAPFKLSILQGRDMSLRGSRSLDYSFCLHQAEETEIYEKLAFARRVQVCTFDLIGLMIICAISY